MDVVAAGHRRLRPRPGSEISSTKRSNRYRASWGPGPASGWYWTVAPGHVAQRQPLDGAVVEVDVGQLGGAEVGLPADRLVGLDRPRAVRAEDREAVVLAGDLGPAGGQVLDRVVGAVVAEGQLVGLQAHRPAQQLMAEADPVDRAACRPARGRCRRRSPARAGSPGPLARKTASGAPASSSSGPAVQGCSSTVAPRARRLRDDRVLDAGVDHGDPRTPRSPARPVGSRIWSVSGVTSRARSRPLIAGSASISARASRLGAAGREHARRASRPRSRMWRTSARVSRSVIAGTPQSVSQLSQPPSAPRGVLAVDAGAHDRRPRVDAVGLHRLGADAVVADLREGEGDQLAGVAGIGHRLLVARHRGGEDDLAHGMASSAPQARPSKRVPSSSRT